MARQWVFLFILATSQIVSAHEPPFSLADEENPLAAYAEQGIDFNAGYDWSQDIPLKARDNNYGVRTIEQRMGIQYRTNENNYSNAIVNRQIDKRYQKVNILTVDTRDEETCHEMALRLREAGSIGPNEFKHFCDPDPANPYVSVAVVGGYTTIGVSYSDLSEREQRLARQTRNFFVPAAGMMVLLYALPRDLTGWEPFDAGAVADKYVHNVTTGPEIEDNEWWINWIGHPYAGAAYYVVARHAGFSRIESFAYSAFMSTFFWEYGVEALSEVPSIQDLLITPVFGALLGEMFIVGEQRILANGGEVLGSRTLGNIAMNLMDPAGWILEQSDKVFEHSPFVDARFSIGLDNRRKADGSARSSPGIRIGIDLFF